MKRRSFLISACVIALVAVLAGCSDAVVYPEFPTGGFITQKGDFLEGQKLDSTKFEVTATYTNGATKTLTGVSIQDDNGTATNGEDIWATVGIDVKGYDVIAEGQVTAYPIDYITAEITGADYKDGDSVAGDEITVTAYYYGADRSTLSSMPLTSDEYGMSTVSAEDGAVVGTVNVWTTIGTVKSTSVEVTVTPDPEDVVTGLASVAVKSASKLAPLAYTEDTLPEYTFDDTVVTGYVNDGTTADTLSGDPGITYTIVDENGLPLRSLDFTTKPTLKLLAEYDGVEYLSSNTITYGTATLSVVYEGEDYVKGEALPAIDPADFYVTLEINGKYEVLDDLPASAFVYYNSGKQYTGTIVPSAGGLAVNVTYMGLTSGDEITLVDKAAATVSSIEASIEGFEGPAKQFYNTLPVFNAKDKLTIVGTKTDATTFEIPVGEVNATYFIDESTPLADLKATANGDYDLTGIDSLLVYVSYGEKLGDFVTVPLTEPEVGTVRLTPKYTYTDSSDNPMINSEIDWTIAVSNDYGMIDYDYAGAKEVYVDGKPASALPGNVGETAINNVVVKVDGVESAQGVNVPVGTPFINGENIKVTIASTYTPYIDEVISTTSTNYVIDPESWSKTGDGATAPTVVADSVRTQVTGAKVLATGNTVFVKVTYVDSTGESVTREVPVEKFNGKAWGEISTLSIVWAETGDAVTEIPAGNHNVNEFEVKGYTGHGTDLTLTVTPQHGSAITSGVFSVGQYETVTFSYAYVAKDGEKTGEIAKISVGAPASTN